MIYLLIAVATVSTVLITAADGVAQSALRGLPPSQLSRVFYNNGAMIEDSATGTKTRFNSFVQMRSEFSNFDSDGGKQDTSGASITLLRLSVAGEVPQKGFSYKVEGDLVGKRSSSGLRSVDLKDAFLEWSPESYSRLKLGQFKVPLSRQYTSSDAKLQFADRSVASDTFNLSRQFGGATTLLLADPELSLGIGIFNGLSDGEAGSNRVGTDTGHSGATTLRWTPLGNLDALSEGDVDYTTEGALSFGSSYVYSRGSNNRGNGEADSSDTRGTIDASFKYRGISLHGEAYSMDFDSDIDLDSRHPRGYYLQGGVFILPKELEFVARISGVDCDGGLYSGPCKGITNIREATTGITYYFMKHSLKAQLNLVFQNQRTPEGDTLHNQRAVVQISAHL